MKLAIHQNKGVFTESWIKYCRDNNIQFILVNCFDSDIISQLNGCDGLMWHWNLNDYKVALMARQLTFSLVKKGIKVYPNIDTGWHYNDKLGQKYLLEAIDAPIVPSYIFYSKQAAIKWLLNATFPKVFKLRNGASSSNVRLVKNKQEAMKLVNKAFGKGFDHVNSYSRLKQRIYTFSLKRDLFSVKLILGGFARLFIPTEVERLSNKEKDYIYFQDFMPDNFCDFRIHIVGNYCWGFQRAVRKNDFRASGSGIQSFDLSEFPIEMIRNAFDIASKLNLQSIAFDFVINQKNQPGLVEMSYCFGFDDEDISYGYWTPDLVFHKTEFNPFNEIIINFINSLNSNG